MIEATCFLNGCLSVSTANEGELPIVPHRNHDR